MSILTFATNKKERVSVRKIYDKRYFYYVYACFFIYLMTIAIKMCYSAQMVSIMEDFNASKSEISKGLTVYYFIYAVAQIVLAPQVKRMNMRNFLVASPLCISVLTPLSTSSFPKDLCRSSTLISTSASVLITCGEPPF